MQRNFRIFLAAVLTAVLAALTLTGCGGSKTPGVETIKRPAVRSDEMQFKGPGSGDTVAVIETSAGTIRVQLYPDKAPQTVENFVQLAKDGFYNDTTFSRLEHGFCVEAGLNAEGVTTTIWNGAGFAPELTDDLHHYSGALCAPVDASGLCSGVFYFMQTLPDSVTEEMAAQMKEAGYSDAVIEAYTKAGGAPYLDYTDTVFGQVYEGMDVVDTIAQSASFEEPVRILKVSVSG